ncbi:MAG TPA: permease-like cell division protein FtsX, partial [Candidatus Caenarcaniphilales bacterium]
EGLLNQVGSQLEVSVYLKPGVAAETLRADVEKLPQVATVEVVSKEQAWSALLSDLNASEIQGVTQQLGGNPLVDELKVTVQAPVAVPRVAQQLSQLQGVDGVQYLDEALKHLEKLKQGLNWIGFIVTTILTVTAVSVITTTIRLIVTARRQEIEVMQLVGATTSWIFLPFVLQGIAFGLIGAFTAWSFISATQRFVYYLLVQQPNFLQFLINSLQLSLREQILLPLILLGFGALVGVVGSLLAVRRFVS